MHYLYRPTEFANMCFYNFTRDIEVVSIQKSDNKAELFFFRDEHPQATQFACKYRARPVIPVFPWTWFPSTRSFETTILTPPNENEKDYLDKELYSRRFLILFYPFRTIDNLKLDGSFVKKFQRAYHAECFDSDTINVANNPNAIPLRVFIK